MKKATSLPNSPAGRERAPRSNWNIEHADRRFLCQGLGSIKRRHRRRKISIAFETASLATPRLTRATRFLKAAAPIADVCFQVRVWLLQRRMTEFANTLERRKRSPIPLQNLIESISQDEDRSDTAQSLSKRGCVKAADDTARRLRLDILGRPDCLKGDVTL
jgi:hypothetical protein